MPATSGVLHNLGIEAVTAWRCVHASLILKLEVK